MFLVGIVKIRSGNDNSLILRAITPVFVFRKINSEWNLETLMLTGAKYVTPKNLIT